MFLREYSVGLIPPFLLKETLAACSYGSAQERFLAVMPAGLEEGLRGKVVQINHVFWSVLDSPQAVFWGDYDIYVDRWRFTLRGPSFSQWEDSYDREAPIRLFAASDLPLSWLPPMTKPVMMAVGGASFEYGSVSALLEDLMHIFIERAPRQCRRREEPLFYEGGDVARSMDGRRSDHRLLANLQRVRDDPLKGHLDADLLAAHVACHLAKVPPLPPPPEEPGRARLLHPHAQGGSPRKLLAERDSRGSLWPSRGRPMAPAPLRHAPHT